MIYQIKDWEVFENHKSRILGSLRYVCVPNKHHGLGLTRVLTEPNGMAIYGAWMLMVQLCSQQAVRSGWLTDGGMPTDVAYTAEDIALKFRQPPELITLALGVLSSPRIGWLVPHDKPPVAKRSPGSAGKRRVADAETPGSAGQPPAQSPATPPVVHEAPGSADSKRIGSDRIGSDRSGMEGIGSEEIKALSGKPDAPSLEPEVPSAKKFKRSATIELAKGVLEHLNEMTGREYKLSASNLEPIAIRLEEVDLDTDGVNHMIDRQCALWKTDEKMSHYLRVSTLFNATKFNEYYSAKDLPVTVGRQGPNHEGGF